MVTTRSGLTTAPLVSNERWMPMSKGDYLNILDSIYLDFHEDLLDYLQGPSGKNVDINKAPYNCPPLMHTAVAVNASGCIKVLLDHGAA